MATATSTVGPQTPATGTTGPVALAPSLAYSDLVHSLLDVYKHHFELLVKGYVVYVTVIGATGWFALQADTPPDLRNSLLQFVSVISFLGCVVWGNGLIWFSKLRRLLLEDPTAGPKTADLIYPARLSVAVAMLGAITFTVAALVLQIRQ